MKDEIKTLVEDLLNIEEISQYSFRKICGFTFVIKSQTIFINEQCTSAEIKPVAIIYEENDEYYLAPLDVIDDIEGIVKDYVKSCM